MLSPRLCFALFVHAVLGTFGEMLLISFNTMAIPLQHFFNQSFYEHYDVVLNEQSFSLVFGLMYVCLPIGAFVSTIWLLPLMDRLGRKPIATTCRSAFYLIGAVISVLAHKLNALELYAVAQFFVGLGTPLKLITKIYLAECAPDQYRGFVTMAINSGMIFGNLIVLAISLPSAFGNDELWSFLPFICALLALLHFSMAIFLPESPKFLYMHTKDLAKCGEVVRFYHGGDADEDVIFGEYEREQRITTSERYSLRSVLRDRSLRSPFFLVLLSIAIPLVSSLSIEGSYSTIILTTFGLHGDQVMLTTIAISLAVLPIALLSPILVERFGRRPMFLISAMLLILQSVLLGASQSIVDIHKVNESPLAAILGILSMLSGSIASMAGVHGFTAILIAELCPPSTRVAVGQTTILVSLFLGMIIVFIYPILTAISGAVFFVPLIGVQILLLFLLFRDLPETKAMPVDVNFARLDEKIRSRANTAGLFRSALDGISTTRLRINSLLPERRPLLSKERHLYGAMQRGRTKTIS